MNFAPIVLFTYNRPQHTRLTVEALLRNEQAAESDLIIYSDAPNNEDAKQGVAATREYLKTITGFKSLKIIERDKNWGLADNIIDGVTQIVNEYGKVIVLEDDLLTSPYFLKFMNDGLNQYEQEDDVVSIHGYVYPLKGNLPDTYFLKGADCWGWATWKRGWVVFNPDGAALLSELQRTRRTREFDFGGSYPYTKMLKAQAEGKVGSWAIRWYASAFLANKLTLYPHRSLIAYNGNDGSGTNCGTTDESETPMATTPVPVASIEVKESALARKLFTHYFRYTRHQRRIKSFLKKIFTK
jgi:hypothetical protein